MSLIVKNHGFERLVFVEGQTLAEDFLKFRRTFKMTKLWVWNWFYRFILLECLFFPSNKLVWSDSLLNRLFAEKRVQKLTTFRIQIHFAVSVTSNLVRNLKVCKGQENFQDQFLKYLKSTLRDDLSKNPSKPTQVLQNNPYFFPLQRFLRQVNVIWHANWQ